MPKEPKPQTQNQFDLLHELRESKDMSRMPEKQRNFLSKPENIQRMNFDQSSNAIQALFNCPNRGETPQGTYQQREWPNVIEGRYFITDPKDNVEKFIHVDKPTEGKWAGYTFVKVRASDDLYPVRDRQHREMILDEISKDPVTAMNEYGQKLGVCGRCGRTLTQIDSRLRGLGPICAGIVREEYSIPIPLDTVTELLRGSE